MKGLSLQRAFLLFVVIISWLGLILITITTFQETTNGPLLTFANMISYFTVQSNIIVALFSTYLFFRKRSFGKLENVLYLGSLINISVTGIIYTVVLASIWDPQGLTYIANALIHYVTPLIYVLYFILFQEKRKIEYGLVFQWLLYPLVYIVYTLVRGPMVNFYPYPFVDASVVSPTQLMINCFGMGIFILIVGFILVLINNASSGKQKK